MADSPLRLGIVMDPIESISAYKDSSFAMLLEAQRRNAEIHYFLQADLKLLSGKAIGRSRRLTVHDDNESWFELGSDAKIDLGGLDVILMRKDAPLHGIYLYELYPRSCPAGRGADR